MAKTYKAFLERVISQRALRSELGVRLLGGIGHVLDELIDGARQAVRASWIGDNDTGPAYDALTPAGDELSLPRYPRETWEFYHYRLQRAWEDWPLAGHESSLKEQLEASGFPGAIFFYASDWPASGRPDWWSQFWVYFPASTHSIIAPGPEIGSFFVGDGTVIGPVGLDPRDFVAMKSIVKKFKPAHYVCSGIVFEISGWTYGTGHTWGESGLVWGGESAILEVF